MSNIAFPPIAFQLASIEAVRPVFLIVMGVFLMLIAWRLAKTSSCWTGRVLVSGAFLLGFGYAILLPLYEAGIIEPISRSGHYHGSPATAHAWQAVKMIVMNFGWLAFGLGLAMHAKLLHSPQRSKAQTSPLASHESIA